MRGSICWCGVLSVIAFHEKAGRSQVGSFVFSLDKVFLFLPSSHCRHASIRTLEERSFRSGACWAFSVQPVLPSVWRPVVSPRWNVGQAFYAVTGTRLWALYSSSWNDFNFVLPFCLTQLAQLSLGCCYAMARTLLRLPRGDATTPPVFEPWR